MKKPHGYKTLAEWSCRRAGQGFHLNAATVQGLVGLSGRSSVPPHFLCVRSEPWGGYTQPLARDKRQGCVPVSAAAGRSPGCQRCQHSEFPPILSFLSFLEILKLTGEKKKSNGLCFIPPPQLLGSRRRREQAERRGGDAAVADVRVEDGN